MHPSAEAATIRPRCSFSFVGWGSRRSLSSWVRPVFVFAESASAYPEYGADIPNGRFYYSSAASATNTRCWLCHTNTYGGYGCSAGTNPCLNPFGMDFQSQGRAWSRTLASMDSDDDGWTNGQELQNEWADTATGRRSVQYSLPGNTSGLTCNTIPAGTLRDRCNADFASGGSYGYGGKTTNSSRFEWLESYYDTCSSGLNDCESQANCSRNVANGRGDWDCACDDSYTGNGHDRTASHDWDAPNQFLASNNERLFVLYPSGQFNACVSKCTPNPCGAGSCSHINGGNGYTCACSSGYQFNGTSCVIANECSGSNPCGMGTCIERSPPATYDCTCDPGYVDDGTTCVVDNPCVAGTDNCNANATCTPNPRVRDGYTCACDAGWQGTGYGRGGCTDIDECTATPRICGPGTCTNGSGSYRCRCNAGYESNGTTCVDIDECLAMPCGAGGAGCTNQNGSYTCACAAGYAFMGGTCADIDECAASPCGMGTCEQLAPPDYTCACSGGYAFDGTTCVDVDECATGTAGCDANATCANRVGSFRCTCNDGYEGSGTTCTDFDECANDAFNDCSVFAACINDTPGYDCECLPGYMGSGVDCTRIDPCATTNCGDHEFCRGDGDGIAVCECVPGFQRPREGADCISACGDGNRVPGEECDDGNVSDDGPDGEPDGCSARCTIEPGFSCYEPDGEGSICENVCGNGFIDTRAGETCDLGPDGAYDDVTPDACRSNCRLGYCGDGVLDSAESCDDGAMISDERPDACRETGCVPAYCGDGVIDTGEDCDFGEAGGSERDDCNSCVPPDMGSAGPLSDAGSEPDGATDDGCGCSIPGNPASNRWPWVVLGLALLGWRRRPRR